MTLYDTLGVDEKATDSEIKKAYRKRARETHPDQNEGTDDEFKDVNNAYAVLSVPRKRKEYDDTGSSDTLSDTERAKQRAFEEIKGMFLKLVESYSDRVFGMDVVKHMLTVTGETMDKNQRDIRNIGQRIEKWEKIQEKISFDGKGANLLSIVCDEQISALKANVEMCEHNIMIMEKIEQILTEYGWEVATEMASSGSYTSSFFNNATRTW